MKIRFLNTKESFGNLRVVVSLLAVLALVLGSAFTARAQNTTASVRGTVMDEQGAAIAGADVTIANADTGDSRSDRTDKDGAYAFPSLPIGRYTLSATKEGFKGFQLKDIVVHVGDSLTLDAQLKVGAKTETIEVVAAANQVELANAELSGTVSGAQITQLPLNGRSFAQLLTLVPGVAQDNGFAYNQKGLTGGADLSISGGASNANTFLVDGANNVDIGSGRTLLVYPSIDSIEEFKVERNSYGAQFGGNSGGQVTLVTKSGTNDFHGSAYWFGRNDYVNANNTNLKANNPGAKTPMLRRNDFGYTVGGPVKKDKIFFFWSQEWNRQITGRVNSGRVPTALERTGYFSDQANDAAANSTNTIGCLPKAGLADPGSGAGGAFTASPNNIATQTGANFIDVIPSSRMSNAGDGVLKTYFLPTLPRLTGGVLTPNYGCGTNFSKSFNQSNNFREESVRGDVNLTKSVRLMLKYIQDINTFGPPATGSSGWGADSGTSLLSETWKQPSRVAVARLSKTIGTSAVNDFQFSFSDNRILISPTNQAATTALSSLFTQFMPATNKGFTPANGPGTWINAGNLPNVWNFGPWANAEDLYTFQDDFSKVIGRHTLRLGALYSRNQKNQDLFDTENGVLNGSVGFNGCKGTGADQPLVCQSLPANHTGYGTSDMFLSGMAFGWGEQGNFFANLGRWENLEWYVNDDVKMNSRLTVNLGMRYSYLPNPYAANDKYTIFNQAAFNPLLGNQPCNGLFYSAGLLANPCPPGTGGLPGPNRAIRNNYNRGFAPRLGVAWDPTGSGKWALRAGFGQFYNRDDISLTDGLGGVNPPFVANFRSINGNGRFLDNTNPLPACGNAAATCFGAGLGSPSVGNELAARQPYTLQYNLTVQHEIWKDTRIEVGYVASRTKNAQSKYDANAINPTDRLAFAQSNGNLNSLKPFNVINSGNIGIYSYHGTASYDSLQAAFNTRLQHGVSLALVYTYSKTISDVPLRSNNGGGNLILDPFNPGASNGLATIHRPHIFAANFIYDTPTMHNWNKIERSALENWEVGSIINASSGTPYTPAIGGFNVPGSNAADLSGIGLGDGNYRPNIVTGQPCRNSSFNRFQWINPNRYTLNGFKLGTIGNAPVGDCLGPGVARVDLSLSRFIRLTERLKLQIRVDAFNLFNHPQYGNPNNGNTNGFASIGFNSVNTAGSPAYLDANGAPTTLANAVSIANSTPNSVVGTVTADNQRDRQLQYSIRFTF